MGRKDAPIHAAPRLTWKDLTMPLPKSLTAASLLVMAAFPLASAEDHPMGFFVTSVEPGNGYFYCFAVD
ncbi:MAG: hypothetical protein WDZ54_08365 [Sneathiella sp.]